MELEKMSDNASDIPNIGNDSSSLSDVTSIDDVRIVDTEPSLMHKKISEKVFGYKETVNNKVVEKYANTKNNSSDSFVGSCDIVKTRMGISIIAGLLFIIFFVLSPIDNLLTKLGFNSITLLTLKGILFCVCLYVVMYKLNICIS